jgi:type IV pilus assembly protein PilA
MRPKLRDDQQGFTLIELLVVILIIGILAAIAIPALTSQRAKAQDAAAKSLARQAQTAMETHWHSNRTYALGTAAALQAIEPSLRPEAGGPTLGAPSLLTATGYRVVVTSKTTNVFTVTRAVTGLVTRTCTRPLPRGGCRNSMTW